MAFNYHKRKKQPSIRRQISDSGQDFPFEVLSAPRENDQASEHQIGFVWLSNHEIGPVVSKICPRLFWIIGPFIGPRRNRWPIYCTHLQVVPMSYYK